ncbi:MAG: sodium/proline symporter, partial [Woeseiaceae bacterium]
IAAVVMVVFLGAYAAAQISAGGKALQGVFGWNPATGAVIVATMIVCYSIAGGIRASIWTDAIQSTVMLVAMATLFGVALSGVGGWSAAVDEMRSIPAFLDLFPSDLLFPGATGMVLFVIGWMFAGFSVVGQPHVMVRFMALDTPRNLTRARAWYYSYFTIFYALATGVGMLSRLYLPELDGLDPELALPTMALELLPAFLVGMILAGVFAATMSTADSLVLSCSATVTHDLLPRRLERPSELKIATAAVTALALAIALTDNRSVFHLVILSWSTLASAFAPMLTIYSGGRRLTETAAIATMAIGVAVAILWRTLGFQDVVYEGLPGIAAGLVAAWFLSSSKQPSTNDRAALSQDTEIHS